MELGVCYYPEHWPESRWADDARRMAELGLRWVRIAEFAWSRIEPEPGRFDWAWLDRAVHTLASAGLKIVMCTPTATPPKWLIDRHPDILAHGLDGQPRRFGSRRHYDFSSRVYRAESQRITRAVAERYGQHPAVAAWQTDNEYGCHDTILSTSPEALRAFRLWLARRYGTIAALNEAWGTVFWSQEYRHVDEIDFPAQTVTEANPSHRLDWRRFASSEVRAFNAEQVALLREHSPGRPVSHNFMGFFTEFDHHEVAQDLDIATWDSYPLGFTQDFFFTPEEKVRWAETGHPDIPAFHHDLYRGMTAGGRWWVMEQQPGPVNWARWNTCPAPGMVRLWTWQAWAHGAEVVSYFRWRQAPFAQEQMHAGLLRPDNVEAPGFFEARRVVADLQSLGLAQPDPGVRRDDGKEVVTPALPSVTPALPSVTPAKAGVCFLDSATATEDPGVRRDDEGLKGDGGVGLHRPPAPVALVLDYPSLWMARIQPQGADYNPLELTFRVYSALRGLGLDVDIVSAEAPLDGRALVVLPASLHVSEGLAQRLTQAAAQSTQVVLGPRTGSKTATLQIPPELPPGPLQALSGVRVTRAASLPPGFTPELSGPNGARAMATRWLDEWEILGNDTQTRWATAHGQAAVVQRGPVTTVGTWLDAEGWRNVLADAARAAGLQVTPLPEHLRISRHPQFTLIQNFSDQPVDLRTYFLEGSPLDADPGVRRDDGRETSGPGVSWDDRREVADPGVRRDDGEEVVTPANAGVCAEDLASTRLIPPHGLAWFTPDPHPSTLRTPLRNALLTPLPTPNPAPHPAPAHQRP